MSALQHIRLVHEELDVVHSYVIRWCFRRLTEAVKAKMRAWDGISIFIDRHKPNETNRITLM